MNIRHAFRALLRTPTFTAAVILTLALGIAAATTMFAIVHGVLLAPLPFSEPERLVSIGWESSRQPGLGQPLVLQSVYQRSATQIEAIGFYRSGEGESNVWDENSREPAERIRASWVGPGTLDLLGVPPLLGRGFSDDEYRMGGAGAVILSEAEWRMRFQADPNVLGKTLMVNSVRRQIIGVMPAQFAFPRAETRLWLPGRLADDAPIADFSYMGVARLKPGVSPAQVQQELAALLPDLAATSPRLQSGGTTQDWLDAMQPQPVVRPLHDTLTQGAAHTLGLLAAAAVLVLLVAWANVANLMLIRADTQRGEQAIRQALGAHGLRAQWHSLAEPTLLAVAAAALALPLSWMGVQLFVALSPAALPRLSGLGLDAPTVAVALLLAGLSAALCAVVAQLSTRASSLAAAARGAGTRASGTRLQAIVVAAQFAVALAITAGAVLLLRSAQALQDVDPGFDADRVTTVWTQLPFATYGEARSVAFYAALSARVRELPAVDAAGLAMRLPLAGGEPLQQTFRADHDGRALTLPINVVDDDYFRALRIPVLAGRGFRRSEHEQAANIVLSQSAATALFGGADGTQAIGRQLSLDPVGPVYTVVGVVGDVRDRALASAPVPTLYRAPLLPIDPQHEPPARRSLALLVRSKDAGSADTLIAAVRAIVYELDPTVPVSAAESMQAISAASTSRLALTLQLMTGAAIVTVLLGSLGLYGAMAYMVALRGREFGIRAALGAGPLRIARLVALRGTTLAAIGICAGLALYAVLAPSLRGLLYGVSSLDATSLSFAVLLMLLTAALACGLPARQAARIAPMEALRR